MKYKFKYKKNFFWISKEVIGHALERKSNGEFDDNRMVLYFENGSIEVICNWSKCSLILGQDWVIAQKTAMEKEIGQPIKLNVSSK
jgi:hypothetical protein